MKSHRRRRFSKPSVIKRNPKKPSRFQHKKRKSNAVLFRPRVKPFAEKNSFLNRQSVNTFPAHLLSPKNKPKPLLIRPQKSWWTPVWNGIVMDGAATHQKAMRQAIWLYLFLLGAANRRTGILYRKLSTISEETGFPRRSVERWLHTLREKGYIKTVSTGRALHIAISKWKPITAKGNKYNGKAINHSPMPNDL